MSAGNSAWPFSTTFLTRATRRLIIVTRSLDGSAARDPQHSMELVTMRFMAMTQADKQGNNYTLLHA